MKRKVVLDDLQREPSLVKLGKGRRNENGLGAGEMSKSKFYPIAPVTVQQLLDWQR